MKIEKPWGFEEILTDKDSSYVMKLIHVNASCRLSLQYHDQKTETQVLVKGQCKRVYENERGELVEEEMELLKGYTNYPNRKHRLIAVTDCIVAEASTKEIGMTYRLEDDYNRVDENEEERNKLHSNM